MKISINSVNFLEFFASFLYDTGKLFRFVKSRYFRSKKREAFIRKYVYLYERLIFSAAFCGWYTLYRKKGRIRSYEFNSDKLTICQTGRTDPGTVE